MKGWKESEIIEVQSVGMLPWSILSMQSRAKRWPLAAEVVYHRSSLAGNQLSFYYKYQAGCHSDKRDSSVSRTTSPRLVDKSEPWASVEFKLKTLGVSQWQLQSPVLWRKPSWCHVLHVCIKPYQLVQGSWSPWPNGLVCPLQSDSFIW